MRSNLLRKLRANIWYASIRQDGVQKSVLGAATDSRVADFASSYILLPLHFFLFLTLYTASSILPRQNLAFPKQSINSRWISPSVFWEGLFELFQTLFLGFL